MIYLRKDAFPHILLETQKRTVHIRTVRFVLHVMENGRRTEKQLSRSRFSFASFLLKRKEGDTISFLEEKKQKTLRGEGVLRGKRCFPARPVQNGKTDGSYVYRPFCASCRRKQQARRRKAFPQTTFFCFLFFLERKGRPQGKARAGRSCNRRAKTVYCFCRYST